MVDPIRVGVSACLVGEPVRFDASHRRDRGAVEALSEHVEWVPVCPEVGAGLGVPREPIRLVKTSGGARLRGSRSGHDVTDAVEGYARRVLRELEALELCGFVLKARSPSCGLSRVRVHAPEGGPVGSSPGVFARLLGDALPLVPIEEEGRLHDPLLRETFFDAVFALARLRALARDGITPGRLVAFHTREKYLLRAHDPSGYRELGRLVARAGEIAAGAGGRPPEPYARLFMDTFRSCGSVGTHVDVLQHMAGHLKRSLSPGSRAELAEAIADYRGGTVPRSVPQALVRHHAREQGEPLLEQTYLDPFPKPLRALGAGQARRRNDR